MVLRVVRTINIGSGPGIKHTGRFKPVFPQWPPAPVLSCHCTWQALRESYCRCGYSSHLESWWCCNRTSVFRSGTQSACFGPLCSLSGAWAMRCDQSQSQHKLVLVLLVKLVLVLVKLVLVLVSLVSWLAEPLATLLHDCGLKRWFDKREKDYQEQRVGKRNQKIWMWPSCFQLRFILLAFLVLSTLRPKKRG